MKLSSILTSIIGCIALTLGVYVFLIADVKRYEYLVVFGILAVVFVTIIILQAEIDWYWWMRHPPEMPAPLEHQLATMIPFYRRLDSIEKKRFRDRCMLWVNGKEFLLQGLKSFPEDVKNLIAAYAVILTFGTEKYLLQPYERLVLYPHPFPSPDFQFLHNSEINDEDGVVIFNAQPLMNGINNFRQHYNLILHEYSHAFIMNYPEHSFPSFTENIPQLAEIRGITLATIEKTVGIPDIDIRRVAIEHFFISPVRFHEILPDKYQRLCEIFNMNPLNAVRPVLQIEKIGNNPLAGE
jgi:Mlc titration factor MtfA (ptsG expression regulator)